jgi:hypothetical protein
MACLPLMGGNVAMLIPVAGGVQVNGQPLAAAGTAIGAGDRVAIDTRGTARMVISGGTVIAAAKTIFRLEDNQAIRLSYGMVKIAGNVPVYLNSRSVVPASGSARYIVTALSGPVYVQAVQGSVIIRRGNTTYTVNEGNAAMFQDTSAGGQAAGGAQTPDQNAPAQQQQTTTPDQNAPAQQQQATPPDQNAPAQQQQTTTPDQNAPAAGTTTTQQSTTTTEQTPAQTQSTTTTTTGTETTTTTTATQQPAAPGAAATAPTVAVPVAIAIIAAAAAVTGIITYEVTKCTGCVSSPSQ